MFFKINALSVPRDEEIMMASGEVAAQPPSNHEASLRGVPRREEDLPPH